MHLHGFALKASRYGLAILLPVFLLTSCTGTGDPYRTRSDAGRTNSSTSSAADRQLERVLSAVIDRKPPYELEAKLNGNSLPAAESQAQALAGSGQSFTLSGWDLQELAAALRDSRKTVVQKQSQEAQMLEVQLAAEDWTLQMGNRWRKLLSELKNREDELVAQARSTLPPEKLAGFESELSRGPQTAREKLEKAVQSLRAEDNMCRIYLRSDTLVPERVEVQTVLGYGKESSPGQETYMFTYTIH